MNKYKGHQKRPIVALISAFLSGGSICFAAHGEWWYLVATVGLLICACSLMSHSLEIASMGGAGAAATSNHLSDGEYRGERIEGTDYSMVENLATHERLFARIFEGHLPFFKVENGRISPIQRGLLTQDHEDEP